MIDIDCTGIDLTRNTDSLLTSGQVMTYYPILENTVLFILNFSQSNFNLNNAIKADDKNI